MEAFADLRCQDLQVATPTMGVYVGVSQLEYARITLEQKVPVNAYYATGMWLLGLHLCHGQTIKAYIILT